MAFELLLGAFLEDTDEEDIALLQIKQAFDIDKPGEILRSWYGFAAGQILHARIAVLPKYDRERIPVGLPLHGHGVAFGISVVLAVVAEI